VFGFGQREVQDRFSMDAIGKPYRFVPPRFGRFIPSLLQRCLPWYMDHKYGIEHWEVRGAKGLRASIDAGHGVILTPNHSRDSDSVGIGFTGIRASTFPHFMAGWHVLLESRFQQFIIPRAGGFSVLREGNDRKSVRTAIDLVAQNSRPLILFPEGYVTRTNDRLGNLQEGAVLIARQAASQRARKNNGLAVVHPVIIKYQFCGDFQKVAESKLARLEKNLSLSKDPSAALIGRLERVREAIIRDREKKALGEASGSLLEKRVPRLIDALLNPLEEAWGRINDAKDTYDRVRKLRLVILEYSTDKVVIEEENRRLHRQLAQCTWALKLSSYNPDYLAKEPCIERYMETLDSLEEDVFGSIQVTRPWRMVLKIGNVIPVSPRDKMLGQQLKEAMEKQLATLATEFNQPLP